MKQPRLLIDIGNTRLKWRWETANGDIDGATDVADLMAAYLGSNSSTVGRLAETWRRGAPMSAVDNDGRVEPAVALLACVAAEPLAQVAQTAAKIIGFELRRVHTVAQAAGVTNGYCLPAQLGVDRWLGLLAAGALGMPTVVAGVGTALTLDVLGADGVHRGGLLSAGPAMMESALLERTARIAMHAGLETPAVQEGLGRNTRGGLRAGSWLAAAALTERVARDTAAKHQSTVALVMTGGDAAAVAELLPADDRWQLHIVPDLVLRGLSRVAEGVLRGEADCGMMTR